MWMEGRAVQCIMVIGIVGGTQREREDALRALALPSFERITATDLLAEIPGTMMLTFGDPVTRVVRDYDDLLMPQRKALVKRPLADLVFLLPSLTKKDPLRAQLTQVIDIATPTAKSLPGWLAVKAAEAQIPLTNAVARMIVARVDGDAERALTELHKLAALPQITAADIDALVVGEDGDVAPWGWVDGILRRDLRGALTALATLTSSNPFQLLGILQGRMLALAALTVGANAESVGATPAAWRSAESAQRAGWTRAQVHHAIGELIDCELRLKGGSRMDEHLIILRATVRMLAR